jgi:hypothetical protein
MRSGDDVHTHDYTESIKTEIARLEGEGKWKKLVASTFSDYILQKAGDLYVFQVLLSVVSSEKTYQIGYDTFGTHILWRKSLKIPKGVIRHRK